MNGPERIASKGLGKSNRAHGVKAAALKLGFVTEAEFDRVVDPKKMVNANVATA